MVGDGTEPGTGKSIEELKAQAEEAAKAQATADNQREEQARIERERAEEAERRQRQVIPDSSKRKELLKQAKGLQDQIDKFRAKGIEAGIQEAESISSELEDSQAAMEALDADFQATSEVLGLLSQSLKGRQLNDPTVAEETRLAIMEAKQQFQRLSGEKEKLAESIKSSENKQVPPEDANAYQQLIYRLGDLNAEITDLEYLRFDGYIDFDSERAQLAEKVPEDVEDKDKWIADQIHKKVHGKHEPNEPMLGHLADEAKKEQQERDFIFYAVRSGESTAHSNLDRNAMEARQDFLRTMTDKFFSLEFDELPPQVDRKKAQHDMYVALLDHNMNDSASRAKEKSEGPTIEYYAKGKTLKAMTGISGSPTNIYCLAEERRLRAISAGRYGEQQEFDAMSKEIKEKFPKYVDMYNYMAATCEGSGPFGGIVVSGFNNEGLNEQMQRFGVAEHRTNGPIFPKGATAHEKEEISKQFAEYKAAAIEKAEAIREKRIKSLELELKAAEERLAPIKAEVDEMKQAHSQHKARVGAEGATSYEARIDEKIREIVKKIEKARNEHSDAEFDASHPKKYLGVTAPGARAKAEAKVEAAGKKIILLERELKEEKEREQAYMQERDKGKDYHEYHKTVVQARDLQKEVDRLSRELEAAKNLKIG